MTLDEHTKREDASPSSHEAKARSLPRYGPQGWVRSLHGDTDRWIWGWRGCSWGSRRSCSECGPGPGSPGIDCQRWRSLCRISSCRETWRQLNPASPVSRPAYTSWPLSLTPVWTVSFLLSYWACVCLYWSVRWMETRLHPELGLLVWAHIWFGDEM